MNDKSHQPVVFLAVICALWGLLDRHMEYVPLILAVGFGLWAWAIKATSSSTFSSLDDDFI